MALSGLAVLLLGSCGGDTLELSADSFPDERAFDARPAEEAVQDRRGDRPRGGRLIVRPAGGFRLRIGPDASLAGAAREFVAGNGGSRPLDWSVACDVGWLQVVPDAGTFRPDERASVLVRLRGEAVEALAPGTHRAELRFRNRTDGVGDTVRVVELVLPADAGLAVEAPREVLADVDDALEHTLRNEGERTLAWSARPLDPWLRAEPASGSLEPGTTARVRLTVDARAPTNTARRSGVLYRNELDGVGSTLRVVRLGGSAGDAEAPERREHISSGGITWTFDRPVPAGTFANGDPWVVGPVLVTHIQPPSRSGEGRVRNGSMLNPRPGPQLAQGYDSATYGKYKGRGSFLPALNVALDVGPENPLVLPAHSSLISSVSDPEPGARPQLAAASILTVLEAPAPANAFRPPYCGDDKTVRHTTDDLRRELLARLPAVPGTPPWPEVEALFARPWIDHGTDWTGRYLHPKRNMDDYGRELADAVSTAALMLHLDVPAARKETLLVRFVQLGIDLHGVLRGGGAWRPNGGHMSGRKWPILFAGLMLDEPAMMGIGHEFGPATFGEDGQTFVVDAPRPHLGYGPQHVGLPEWGPFHATDPEKDDARWRHTDPFVPGARPDDQRSHGLKYRLCCTANTWWGELLAAYVMGARELWNHEPLFGYQDRFLRVNRELGIDDYRLSLRPFYLNMWERYRDRY